MDTIQTCASPQQKKKILVPDQWKHLLNIGRFTKKKQRNWAGDENAEFLYELLLSSYKMEVESRYMTFQETKETLSVIREVVSFFLNPIYCFLILSGGYGNGKTTLCLAIQRMLNALYIAGQMKEEDERLSIFHSSEIAKLCISNEERFSRISSSLNALGIEDLGDEQATIKSFGNIYNPLASLLENRYQERLLTIITTNLTPKELKSRFGERVADRFSEVAYLVNFRNPSFRSLLRNKV